MKLSATVVCRNTCFPLSMTTAYSSSSLNHMTGRSCAWASSIKVGSEVAGWKRENLERHRTWFSKKTYILLLHVEILSHEETQTLDEEEIWTCSWQISNLLLHGLFGFLVRQWLQMLLQHDTHDWHGLCDLLCDVLTHGDLVVEEQLAVHHVQLGLKEWEDKFSLKGFKSLNNESLGGSPIKPTVSDMDILGGPSVFVSQMVNPKWG